MPTAIIRICTHEGILVAADGLMRKKSTGAIVSENEQKIFQVSGLPLAYAIYGSGKIFDPGLNPAFDFLMEASNSVALMAESMPADISLYVQEFALPIWKHLLRLKQRGIIGNYPGKKEPNEPGESIAHIFFLGYYNDAPSTVDLRFFHKNQMLGEPSIRSLDMEIGLPPLIWGSAIVARALFETKDDRFSDYRTCAPINHQNLTFLEAADVAKNYMLACASKRGREVDPEICPGIGGHIHIAKITPTTGFQWIVPPMANQHQK